MIPEIEGDALLSPVTMRLHTSRGCLQFSGLIERSQFFKNLNSVGHVGASDTHPNYGSSEHAVDLFHLTNLTLPLIEIVLVDTNGVHPEHSGRIVIPKVPKGRLQIDSYWKCLAFKVDIPCEGRISPDIRDCLIRRLLAELGVDKFAVDVGVMIRRWLQSDEYNCI